MHAEITMFFKCMKKFFHVEKVFEYTHGVKPFSIWSRFKVELPLSKQQSQDNTVAVHFVSVVLRGIMW